MTKTALQAQTPRTIEVLEDRSSSGRVRPWREKKMSNELLASVYDFVNPDKAARLRDCCTRLFYRVGADGKKHLDSGNFCRVRLCPLCSWRRALKLFVQVNQVVSAIQSDKPKAYLLLTLTVRNCAAGDLAATIDHMMESWNRMVKYKEFGAVKGWYRGLEITHNVNVLSESYDTFHPHFHVLLAVNKTYFTSREYVTQERWKEIWALAARLDYDPQVDIRKVKGDTARAVSEVAKYTVKDADYIIPEDWDLTVKTVSVLDAALANRRFAAFGGLMKDWHKRLHLDDLEDGDLVRVDGEPDFPETDYSLMSFYWYAGYRQYLRGPNPD